MTHACDVLVVGGSLVGMTMGLLLAHQGARVIVVEHHRGTAIHPRAAQITQRTMEILRSVGIEQIVREKSGEQFVQDGAIMAVDTLDGRELAHFIANLNEGIRDVSPCERVFISQSLLEPLLRRRADEFGADLRFGTDVVSFEQDESGATATLRHRDSGQEELVRARWMVAADGAHSRTRDQLGISMHGHGAFSRSVTIYFRADVTSLLRGRNLSVIYVNNPTLRGFFRFEKPFDSGFLAINALGDPANPITDVATGLTEERAQELVRIALGSDAVPITIENMSQIKCGIVPMPTPGANGGPPQLMVRGMGQPISNLVSLVTQFTGRQVVDKTGLTGNYDFELELPLDMEILRRVAGQAGINLPAGPTPNAPQYDGPAMTTIISERLGLKLDTQKAPVPVLVIDSAEMPAAD